MSKSLVSLLLLVAMALITGLGMANVDVSTQVASTMGPNPPLEAGLSKGEPILPDEVDTVDRFTTIDAKFPVGGKALYIDYTIALAGNNSSSIWAYAQLPMTQTPNGVAIEVPCGCMG